MLVRWRNNWDWRRRREYLCSLYNNTVANKRKVISLALNELLKIVELFFPPSTCDEQNGPGHSLTVRWTSERRGLRWSVNEKDLYCNLTRPRDEGDHRTLTLHSSLTLPFSFVSTPVQTTFFSLSFFHLTRSCVYLGLNSLMAFEQWSEKIDSCRLLKAMESVNEVFFVLLSRSPLSSSAF